METTPPLTRTSDRVGYTADMKHWGWGIIACTIVASIAGCDTPADGPRRAKLKAQADKELSQDMLLAGKLDLSKPAILEELPGYAGNDWAIPACNGYCLRLLYSGEARVVLSGYFAGAEVLKHRNLTPQIWSGADNDTFVLYAYHLERRELCPETAYHDSMPRSREASGASTNESTDERPEHLAYLQIAAGNCLIGEPAELSDATAIVTLTKSHWDGGDMWLIAESVTAYTPAGKALDRRYRKTVVQSLFRQAIAPDWWSPSRTDSDTRNAPDFLRQDLGFRLQNIPAADIDLGAMVLDLLSDTTIDAKSTRWAILGDYLDHLAKSPSLIPADIDLVTRIIADKRTATHLSFHLSDLTRRHGEQAAPLAAPMLRIMAQTQRYGDPSDPSLIAATKRFYSLATAVNNLPAGVIAANQDLLVQVVSDPIRIRDTEYLLSRLDAIDPQKASPVLIRYIAADSTPEAAEAAMAAACRLGPRAPQLRPAVETWIAQHPKTDRERRYRSEPIRRNAETYLAGKGGDCRR